MKLHEMNESCFVVSEQSGRSVAFVYFEKRAELLAGKLSRDEALAYAKQIARSLSGKAS